MNITNITYEEIKAIKVNRNLTFNYVEPEDGKTEIFLVDCLAETVYVTVLQLNVIGKDDTANILDWETNYKSTATLYPSIDDGIAWHYSQFTWPEVSGSKRASLVTPLIHRKPLTYKEIGFNFTTNTNLDGTYNKKSKIISITQPITAGQNYVYVSDIRYIAQYFTYRLVEGNVTENLTVAGIDYDNKKVTFSTAIQNNYTIAAKLNIDTVKVTLDVPNNITYLDYYVTDNNKDSEKNGWDVNGVCIRGNFVDGDKLNIFITHPLYLGVSFSSLVEDVVLLQKDLEKIIEAPTTSTITPGLIIRVVFTAADTTNRLICIDGYVWSFY